ncbi:DUF11 domain-containing protein [Dictyobacter vulcani]|uniref:DUF11 domain-containing protein n=1 Tax=Dictyobacter vulcani TaxID=2607529 RepID=UPI00124F954A|nr:DUF11 domain-containing protein [Dictyobacter vulcani]
MRNVFAIRRGNVGIQNRPQAILRALLFSLLLSGVMLATVSAHPQAATRRHILPADLVIHWSVPQTFQISHVGDTLPFSLIVSNHGDQLTGPVPIWITAKIPGGLTNLQVRSNNNVWHTTYTTSHFTTIVRAYYTGILPLRAGQSLTPLVITGRFTNNAVPDLTLQATVSSPGDTNTKNNSDSYTIGVAPRAINHHR